MICVLALCSLLHKIHQFTFCPSFTCLDIEFTLAFLIYPLRPNAQIG